MPAAPLDAIQITIGNDNLATVAPPVPSLADPRVLKSNCPRQAPSYLKPNFPTVAGYPLPPAPQTMPSQEPGSPRRPSGLRAKTHGK